MAYIPILAPMLSVLKLLKNARNPISGAEISVATGIASGTLYPLLARLEYVGWLTSAWEDPSVAGRPRRRLYVITDVGAEQRT